MMNNVKLNARLAAIAGLVLADEICADIGTDHGMLPVFLVQQGICPHAIASDQAASSLAPAAALIRELGLEHSVEARVGDGLACYRAGEAATVVISGMGGNTIMEILAAEPEKAESAKRLVLQPQRDIPEVRSFLAARGWRIIAEEAVCDGGLYYEIMAAERGEMQLSTLQAKYGPCLLEGRQPIFRELLQYKCGIYESILQKLAAAPNAGAKRQETEAEIAEIKGIIADKFDK